MKQSTFSFFFILSLVAFLFTRKTIGLCTLTVFLTFHLSNNPQIKFRSSVSKKLSLYESTRLLNHKMCPRVDVCVCVDDFPPLRPLTQYNWAIK